MKSLSIDTIELIGEFPEYEGVAIRDPEDSIPGSSTGNSRSSLSNRVSHFLDIRGPR